MDFDLRDVQPSDLPELTVLIGQLGYPTTEDAVRVRLDRWLSDPASRLIGADDGGTLIGVAAVHLSPMLETDGYSARLGALVVDESYRSKGVGQALVAAFEEHAWANGAVKLEITSSRYRTRTHEFYQQLGYEDICSASARFVKTAH